MDPERIDFSIPASRRNRKSEKSKLKGPLRVLRLCILAICIPGLLVAVPLYLRYRVYSEQMVPFGMSDMRILDSKISTTWCQKQLVTSNATFNAYLLSEQPPVRTEPTFVTMVREIVLEDDMREYWGFYLLKGSTVTVSTCCRRPGASLIVIRGHRHLRQCTYIGDDSSEEQDELDETKEKHEELKSFSIPEQMQRARPGVVFRGNDTDRSREKYWLSKELDNADPNDDLGYFLLHPPNDKMKHPVKAVGQVSRLQHVSGEGTYLEEVDSRGSEEVFKAVLKKLKNYEKSGKDVAKQFKNKLDKGKKDENWKWLKTLLQEESNPAESASNDTRRKRSINFSNFLHAELNAHDEDGNAAEEEGVEHHEIRGTINGTTAKDMSNSEFWSSFSSSEERLLECEGLILSQPLVPSPSCRRGRSSDDLDQLCKQQQFSYKVPGNGYYFFVFSSENEVQPNYIRAKFQLERILYNVSNAVASCENSTGQCSLPLNFFSRQKLVLELPVNNSLWNTEFIVISTCEPRTYLYGACVIAVPILILLCAF